MRTSNALRTAIAITLLGPVAMFAAEKPKQISVLLVTGDDAQPAHNWFEVSQAIRETLVSSGKFEVRVSEDAAVLDSAAALKR